MALVPYTNIEDGSLAKANDVNSRFGDTLGQVNGNLDAQNIKNRSITAELLAPDAISASWPVGSVYISVLADNPGPLLGGQWEVFATGRTLVGVDTGQTEFNTVEKTGGHKDMQKHKHSIRRDNSVGGFMPSGSNPGSIKSNGEPNGANTGTFSDRAGSDYNNGANLVSESGTGDSGNLQPYITVYFWKRVS